MQAWTITATAISASFLASLVEVVEAFTVVLAVSTVRGWKPALLGTGAGLAALACMVLILGPLFSVIPLQTLQIAIGVLLLLFGMRWLRKAILRAAGIIPLHDEERAYAAETSQLREEARRRAQRADFIAALTAFKAVVVEGVEVVFIVIAVGAGRGLLGAASLGAAAACGLVLLVGLVIHKPLSRVPENMLKFVVGVMLSAFGVFWTAEGLGAEWPGGDLAIIAIALGFAAVARLSVWLIRRQEAIIVDER